MVYTRIGIVKAVFDWTVEKLRDRGYFGLSNSRDELRDLVALCINGSGDASKFVEILYEKDGELIRFLNSNAENDMLHD